MDLTILGNGPACPNVGGASSGYLVTSGDTSLVLDLGSGIVSTTEFRQALPGLTGIVISHLHIDHWLDLAPLGYLLKVAPRPPRDTHLKVWVPPGSGPQLSEILEILAIGFPCDVFDLEEYDPALPLCLPGLQVTFQQMQHYIPSYAMRLESDQASLVYSADSCLCDSLVAFAQGCGLFLCEATDGTDEPATNVERGHMSAMEAGTAAAGAGVGNLLLTHLWDSHDQESMVRAARTRYSGPCQVAQPGHTYQVHAGSIMGA